VLITGGSGYIAIQLARRLLARGDVRLTLWVHDGPDGGMDARRRLCQQYLGEESNSVAMHGGDLRIERPFESLSGHEFDHIVHSASHTRFDVDAFSAHAINVEGARKLFALAQRQSNLQSLVQLSTVYASGMQSGVIEESLTPDGVGYANEYEASKSQAERVLVSEFNDTPWRIVRLCTVVADSPLGGVTQHNVFHNTMRLLYFGMLSLIPGRPETPVYVCDALATTDAIMATMFRGERKIYQVAPVDKAAISLVEVVDVAMEEFGKCAQFTRRRVMRPLLVEGDVLGHLASGLGSQSMMAHSLATMVPFSRQLAVSKRLECLNARALGVDFRPGYSRELLVAVLSTLVRQGFSKDLIGPNTLGEGETSG